MLDLQRHFGQANADIEKILTSSERISQRGHKIENLEFGEPGPAAEIERRSGAAQAPSPEPSPPRVEPRRNGGARVIRQPDLLAGE